MNEVKSTKESEFNRDDRGAQPYNLGGVIEKIRKIEVKQRGHSNERVNLASREVPDVGLCGLY